MATMDEVCGELSAEQSPIICLDTCDFLDVVRCIALGNLAHIKSFRRMSDSLDLESKQFRLIVTYLTKHEWDQNIIEVEKLAKKFMDDTFHAVRRIGDARYLANLPTAPIDDELFDSRLIEELVELARSVIGRAIAVEKDDSCVARALERVMAQKRPSGKKGVIKDSIHWEHYLELSKQLRAAGHTQPRIFVSANKADFWHKNEKKNELEPTIHLDLKIEADAAGLQFFGYLDDALKTIGV